MLKRAGELLSNGRVVVLTGAGISTDSGIPDYRGRQGIYTRNPDYKPITYQEFVSTHQRRQRYWFRSFLGWPRIERARPNESHQILLDLEAKGIVSGLITQNVDGLHRNKSLVELHGTLHAVDCINCGNRIERKQFQKQILALNPDLVKLGPQSSPDVASSSNPDGDVEAEVDYATFRYPECGECGGMLKPGVVFFGENIRAKVKDAAFHMIHEAKTLVVVASSLKVYSSYRLVKRAHELGIPVIIINDGPTRGDEFANFRIEGHCREALKEIHGLLFT